MRVVAVIQARMGSSRVSGKVLREILGKPMLWHLVSRVQEVEYIDDVVIATTDSRNDDSLEAFAHNFRLGIYRGSENDIVDRILNAGKKYSADAIVRIWGDCPLIDPALIDKVLAEFTEGNYDYANNTNPRTYPAGMDFEVYTLVSLEKIWNETNDSYYRQYPFEYVYDYQDSFRALYDKSDVDLSDIHLTVDYPKDFELVTEIYKHLYDSQQVFHLEDIVRLLEANPDLKTKNKGLARNIEYYRSKKLREGKDNG